MTPSKAQEDAVLAAVCYAGLFDYPLTVAQLCETLGVPADEAAVAGWLAASPGLASALEHQGGFVYPYGRHDLPGTRRRREAMSLPRLRADQPALAFIARLPYVRMVAISGSLAHLNADDGDSSADLDLFLITAPGRVWLVTLAALVVAKLRGWRRRLCLNYVVSEAALAVSPADLFTANQIVHLQPLVGQPVYRRFLDANPFVRAHYPNFVPRQPPANATSGPGFSTRLLEAIVRPAAPLLERAARAAYGWHLARRAGRWASHDGVRLEAECLKLHTSSHRTTVMARFAAALDEARRRARSADPAMHGEAVDHGAVGAHRPLRPLRHSHRRTRAL